MQLLTNEIDAESVRREREGGTDFLVAPVVLVRSMWLNGPPGLDDLYLPQREVEQSAERWEGVPGPIDHPSDGDRPISIHDDRASVPVISEIQNTEVTESKGKQAVAGELWIDIEAARDAGSQGERTITRLENGDAIEVSSGYGVEQIVQGEFDGAHREAAAVGVQPDHVAILPNDKGRCSISDGCGAGAPVAPAVNVLGWAAAADDPDTTPATVATGEDAVSGRSMNREDYTALGRAIDGLTDLVGRGASPGDDERAANASTGDGGGTDDETRGAEPPADPDTDTMGDKTEELVENHGFEADNLPDEDTDCFDRIYEAIANEDGGDEPSNDDDEQTTTSSDDGGNIDVDELADALEERGFATTDDVEEALAANEREDRKGELVDEIASNTDRDPDDLEELSVNALEVLAEELPVGSPAANFAAQRGASPTPSTSDASDFPALTASNRAEELEEGAD